MAVSLLEIFVGITLLVYISSAQESPSNVAVHKTATQSSTFSGTDTYTTPPLQLTASADLAVDGAPTKSYPNKTCAVTKWLDYPYCTNNPWWQVDLGGQYDVFNVTIYQRGAGESDKPNYGPLVVRIGARVERPENRTSYTNRPVVSIPLSPPVTASTVNISVPGCSILTLCEVEVFAVRHVNECNSSPCHHGGSCTDGLFNYTCTCVPGYTGADCETDVDECMLGYCQHGANCLNTAGSYSCSCTVGYTGRNCASDLDECALRYCQSGSTCINTQGSYSCSCGVGYTGRNCSEDVDECALKFCQNGGNCMNTAGSYSCSCVPGFSGRNCSTDVDECASSSCSNHSSCVDGINRYTCECRAGYGGDTCTKPCSGGTFGPGCKKTCSSNCLDVDGGGGQHCDGTTGRCLLEGCKGNHEGPMCMTEEQRRPTGECL